MHKVNMLSMSEMYKENKVLINRKQEEGLKMFYFHFIEFYIPHHSCQQERVFDQSLNHPELTANF